MNASRLLGAGLALIAATAFAGDKWIQNDSFDGTGMVSSSVLFGEGEGCGVLLTPEAADYPLKIVAVDVFTVPITPGGNGDIGAYLLDVWDESSGPIDPPMNSTGNLYSGGVQLTASSTQFNRFTFPSPLIVASGKVFIAFTEQLSSASDGTTIAMDSGPIVQGANWYSTYRAWTAMTGTGSSAPANVNRNWIIRAVLEKPDSLPVVTGVTPASGVNSADVPIAIDGDLFTSTSKVFLGDTELTVSGRVPPHQLFAVVPAGFAPGLYDVTVENPGPVRGTLPAAYRVIAAGDAGTEPDAGAGQDAGSDDRGGDGGVSQGGLTLDSITPDELWREDPADLVLLGAGFEDGVQVMIGERLMDAADRKSASVIQLQVPPATLDEGTYDVSVINPDGTRVALAKALTVHAGYSVKTGCGCSSGAEALGVLPLLLPGLVLWRRRRSRSP